MMQAEDFRLRSDPGPDVVWHMRIWWQHSAAYAADADLKRIKQMVGNVHDVVAMHSP